MRGSLTGPPPHLPALSVVPLPLSGCGRVAQVRDQARSTKVLRSVCVAKAGGRGRREQTARRWTCWSPPPALTPPRAHPLGAHWCHGLSVLALWGGGAARLRSLCRGLLAPGATVASRLLGCRAPQVPPNLGSRDPSALGKWRRVRRLRGKKVRASVRSADRLLSEWVGGARWAPRITYPGDGKEEPGRSFVHRNLQPGWSSPTQPTGTLLASQLVLDAWIADSFFPSLPFIRGKCDFGFLAL